MKRPLADVLQSTTIFCARHRVQLHISHIAGERHDWADWLSRGRYKSPKWWSRLSAEKRFEPNWLELLSPCQTVGQLMRGWLWDDCWLATAVARALFGELWRGLLPACNCWLQPLLLSVPGIKRMCALEGRVSRHNPNMF